MDKMKMHSPDLSQDNIAKIRALFPDCVTEAADEQGNIRLAVDFDQLRQTLSDHIVEGPQERYRLDWPGKREALLTANAPIAKTLRPCREESVDFDTTQNLFIEGDNLDALKLLQESYLGKVKMIYIDPPYNTRKDFIYDDDFAANARDFLIRSNQADEFGGKLVANGEGNGRFHSDWLSMIYARLRIAKNMLSSDGIIFISIDDNEAPNLRSVCDEIFGRKNFCAQFVWNTEGNTDNQYEIKINHEYIVCYYRDRDFSDIAVGKVIDPNTREDSNLWAGIADNNVNKNNPENPPSIVTLPAGFPAKIDKLFYKRKNLDEEFFSICERDKYISDQTKVLYGIESNSGLPVKLDDMVIEGGRLVKECKIFVGYANKNKLLDFISNGCEPINDDGNMMGFYINANAAVRYWRENDSPRNILSVLRNLGTTEKSKTYLKSMDIYYDYPKPVGLLKYLLKIGCSEGGIVVDFFAGSGSTVEAAYALSAEDGCNRKLIVVQIPENLDPVKKSQKAAFDFCVARNIPPNLAEISKERIRRAGKNLLGGQCHDGWNRDVGFRVLKIDSSNMSDVYYRPDDVNQGELFAQVDSVKPDRSGEDLLFQVLLDWGVELTLPISRENLHGKTVYSVDGNALIACFDTGVTDELVKEIAARAPLRAVFRDTSFAHDADRINAEQLFRQLSPGTELKAI